MRRATLAAWLFGLSLVPACSEGVKAPSGAGEPLRVSGGQFVEGDLALAPEVDGGAGEGTRVTFLESLNNVIRPGQGGKVITGRASPGAYSVGVRFADMGTGFWVVPVEGKDPLAMGEQTFSVTCDFSHELPPGVHMLRFAAFDEQGRSAGGTDQKVCVTLPVPDNLSSCSPTAKPPGAVISLSWDTNVDLDLAVVAPSGKTVSPKQPSTALAQDAGVPAEALSAPGVGAIDVDSNAGCAIDGRRRENLVFATAPEPGRYLIYAGLFDACGQRAARFKVQVYLPAEQPDGSSRLGLVLERTGEVTAIDADNGVSRGLFVTEVVFR